MKNHFTGSFFHGWKIILIPIIGAAAIVLFTWLVMLLWNAVLPSVLGVNTVTFLQALGILVLSKILFSGMHGGYKNKYHPVHDWSHKWKDLTDEERARLREKWHSRCYGTEEEKTGI